MVSLPDSGVVHTRRGKLPGSLCTTSRWSVEKYEKSVNSNCYIFLTARCAHRSESASERGIANCLVRRCNCHYNTMLDDVPRSLTAVRADGILVSDVSSRAACSLHRRRSRIGRFSRAAHSRVRKEWAGCEVTGRSRYVPGPGTPCRRAV